MTVAHDDKSENFDQLRFQLTERFSGKKPWFGVSGGLLTSILRCVANHHNKSN